MKVESGQIQDFLQDIREVLFRNKDNKMKLRELFGKNYIFFNNSFYTTHIISEALEFPLKDNNKLYLYHDQKSINKTEMKDNIMGRLVKILLKKLRLKPIGRKLFNVKNS